MRGYIVKKGEVIFRKWFVRINEIYVIVGKVLFVVFIVIVIIVIVFIGDEEVSFVDRKFK